MTVLVGIFCGKKLDSIGVGGKLLVAVKSLYAYMRLL